MQGASGPRVDWNAEAKRSVARILTPTERMVHPTSVHILDSWGGDPPHFHLGGMRGTQRESQWEARGLQYLYRGLFWLTYAAMSFGERALIEKLYAFREQFQQAAAMTQWPDPDQRVRDLRQRGS